MNECVNVHPEIFCMIYDIKKNNVRLYRKKNDISCGNCLIFSLKTMVKLNNLYNKQLLFR